MILTTLLAFAANGQSVSGTITTSGRVSETVLLSIAPHAIRSANETTISYNNLNAHTVLVTIASSGSQPARIAIPAQIRSNVGYTLSVSAKQAGTSRQQLLLRGLSVTGKRATGRFVALDAVEAIDVEAAFDATAHSTERAQRARPIAFLFPSSTATLLTGTPVSLCGTADSPHNAVEVTIQAEVEAPAGATGVGIELLLSVAPNSASSTALASR
jgi:hypothetical protein